MKQILYICAVVWLVLALSGCSQKEKAGGGFELVTPLTVGPDHHPGTALHRNGWRVWGNVYPGYFSGHRPEEFGNGKVYVFVGAVPYEDRWWDYPQLFAVGKSGLPVVLSERLVQKPLIVSYLGDKQVSDYKVVRVEPMKGGVFVQISQGAPIKLTWEQVEGMLKEADTKARLVQNKLGDYRVLGVK